MKVGDRVTPRDNHRQTGTVTKTSNNTVTVKWDDGKAEEQQRKSNSLYIVGHDPTVGDQTGVWHCQQEEKRCKMVAAFLEVC